LWIATAPVDSVSGRAGSEQRPGGDPARMEGEEKKDALTYSGLFGPEAVGKQKIFRRP
jgi:hypothetical protein